MDHGKSMSKIGFTSFDDIFNHPDAYDESAPPPAPQKFSKFAKQNAPPQGNELYELLQKQRLIVDQNAIHFVSQKQTTSRADARNSVFKLAHLYRAIPESENLANIKRMFVNIGAEDEASGDEDWAPSYKKLPSVLIKRMKEREQSKRKDSQLKEDLIAEMDNIENEASDMAASGAVTTEEVVLNEKDLDSQFSFSSPTKLTEAGKGSHGEEEEEEYEDEEDLNDYGRMNTLQREFMGNNLHEWYRNIEQAYSDGVKLVKVNAMGKKFVRAVSIKNGELTVSQPHSRSKANLCRQISLLDVERVEVGQNSREFQVLQSLVDSGAEPAEALPSATLCACIHLTNGRCISFIFLEEQQRNALVFFLRVMLKRLKEDAY